MAISENVLLKKLSGHLGKQLVFKQYGDKTVVSVYPNMKRRKFSDKQKQTHTNMSEANDEAHKIMADEQLRHAAQVRLDVTSNKLYTALIKEYFKRIRAAEKAS